MINRLAHLLTDDEMARKRRVRKQQLGTYIPEDVYAALVDFSNASGIPITRIVEDAIREYLALKYWPIEEDDGSRGGKGR